MNDFQFDTSDTCAQQLAHNVAERLREYINERGRVCMAVSGGQTPVLFFEYLSQQVLDWSKVLITLVDERWVDVVNVASNERLVREHLLQNEASSAYFLPLKNESSLVTDGYMKCENSLHEQITRLDLAILGMGADGHCASWFPGSSALAKCLDEASGARCCPVLDEPNALPRMTLTWHFLSQCRHLYLHFTGQQKQDVFQTVCHADYQQNVSDMPVRSILFQSSVPLSIYRSV